MRRYKGTLTSDDSSKAACNTLQTLLSMQASARGVMCICINGTFRLIQGNGQRYELRISWFLQAMQISLDKETT